jgi:hypothetical protein
MRSIPFGEHRSVGGEKHTFSASLPGPAVPVPGCPGLPGAGGERAGPPADGEGERMVSGPATRAS